MRVVSLFSGAGGLDLGFIRAGHNIVWANDIFIDAVESYKSNLGSHIICENIEEINSNTIPDCDIVIGGFPCQGFSVANTKRSELDSRNILYKQLVRVIADKKPKFFVAENVKGILSLAKGKVMENILSEFSNLDYNVQFKVLNAADYGVPQTRERVIIVGVRSDVDFNYTYPKQTHNQDGSDGFKKWVSISEALSNIPDPDSSHNLLNHEYSKFKLKFNGYIGNRHVNPDKPAPTVTGRGDDKGGVVVLHHPNNTRRMSCRELAAIQSFPLNYFFVGNKSSIYRQIANAVPPTLAYNIAKQIPSKMEDI